MGARLWGGKNSNIVVGCFDIRDTDFAFAQQVDELCSPPNTIFGLSPYQLHQVQPGSLGLVDNDPVVPKILRIPPQVGSLSEVPTSPWQPLEPLLPGEG